MAGAFSSAFSSAFDVQPVAAPKKPPGFWGNSMSMTGFGVGIVKPRAPQMSLTRNDKDFLRQIAETPKNAMLVISLTPQQRTLFLKLAGVVKPLPDKMFGAADAAHQTRLAVDSVRPTSPKVAA